MSSCAICAAELRPEALERAAEGLEEGRVYLLEMGSESSVAVLAPLASKTPRIPEDATLPNPSWLSRSRSCANVTPRWGLPGESVDGTGMPGLNTASASHAGAGLGTVLGLGGSAACSGGIDIKL